MGDVGLACSYLGADRRRLRRSTKPATATRIPPRADPMAMPAMAPPVSDELPPSDGASVEDGEAEDGEAEDDAVVAVSV